MIDNFQFGSSDTFNIGDIELFSGGELIPIQSVVQVRAVPGTRTQSSIRVQCRGPEVQLSGDVGLGPYLQ
eukprot:15290524-Ditylum_brightwellii.AAC.1